MMLLTVLCFCDVYACAMVVGVDLVDPTCGGVVLLLCYESPKIQDLKRVRLLGNSRGRSTDLTNIDPCSIRVAGHLREDQLTHNRSSSKDCRTSSREINRSISFLRCCRNHPQFVGVPNVHICRLTALAKDVKYHRKLIVSILKVQLWFRDRMPNNDEALTSFQISIDEKKFNFDSQPIFDEYVEEEDLFVDNYTPPIFDDCTKEEDSLIDFSSPPIFDHYPDREYFIDGLGVENSFERGENDVYRYAMVVGGIDKRGK
ncbi:hypothetical protein BVC80_8167g1 [Macleaya cordata]|uniref:Uncharacterized protein n=1 Tax=Macleaya cordata TaxID=56857 RepID=A0A200QNG2_MACCD|nr:hypothetical protein BVC80_8167g1 [Macleaya cordata]